MSGSKNLCNTQFKISPFKNIFFEGWYTYDILLAFLGFDKGLLDSLSLFLEIIRQKFQSFLLSSKQFFHLCLVVGSQT